MTRERKPWRRRILVVMTGVVLVFGPLLVAALMHRASALPRWDGDRWASVGRLAAPAASDPAMVHLYAARSWGWKGAFAVHSWIVFKPAGALAYQRYDVVGWGVRNGRGTAVRLNLRPPDARWAGSEPFLVAAIEGEAAARAIPQIEAAIADYPDRERYRVWPGPNSNSFIAHIVRSVPELRTELPSNAIGKDWLRGSVVGMAPSGTGVQISALGLLGVVLALDEGLEINILGLVLGIDPLDLALKLPGLGRLGLR